jgi:diguanylate cyclase (GGDEF)-like protein/PAS domain S-box-containing protein
MNNVGRISVALFAIVSYFIWAMGLQIQKFFNVGHFFSMLFFALVGWWLGKQYDKTLLFKKKSYIYSYAIESSIDGIVILNHKGEFESFNRAFAHMLGYTRSELMKESWEVFYKYEDKNWLSKNIFSIVKNEGAWTGELTATKKDGKCFPQRVTISFIKETEGLVCIVRDVTREKKDERKIQHMAFHDMLTGLPNLRMFNQYLEKALNGYQSNGQKLAVIFLDLDRFKFINDTLGHDMGDLLLKQVSKRITKWVGEGLVARRGGDEFIILLENIEHTQLEEIAERILGIFHTPFLLKEKEYFLSPSIGISCCPKDGEDIETLTKHADMAMYLAKKRGKNNYQFYVQEDEKSLERKIKLEHGLKRALENNEFVLHYQPKVELKTKNIIGVEALIRWNHPELGLVSPVEFIPIAEETGIILPLGNWILQEACKQNKKWQASGIKTKTAVNVSPIQLENPRFVDTIKEILAKNQLSHEYLGLEITESVMQNIDQTSHIIHDLTELGTKFYIDDFGTGYSSLNVLNKLPIKNIKIDKCFVDEMMIDPNTALLVKTILEIGKILNFDVIAEGIESEEQAEFLRQNDCGFGQGYFYSPPVSADEIEKLWNNKFW